MQKVCDTRVQSTEKGKSYPQGLSSRSHAPCRLRRPDRSGRRGSSMDGLMAGGNWMTQAQLREAKLSEIESLLIVKQALSTSRASLLVNPGKLPEVMGSLDQANWSFARLSGDHDLSTCKVQATRLNRKNGTLSIRKPIF